MAELLQVHGRNPPSDWVRRWSHLVVPGGEVLDVACGHGRHTGWFASLQHPVVAVDRCPNAIHSVTTAAPAAKTLVADLENGPWPFTGRQFAAVVVTNYLWRPLMPALLGSLASKGVLLYETFTQGNESVGKPSRPEFLLRPGELLTCCQGLRVVAFEDGFTDAANGSLPRFIQRIAAVREAAAVEAATTPPVRYWLR